MKDVSCGSCLGCCFVVVASASGMVICARLGLDIDLPTACWFWGLHDYFQSLFAVSDESRALGEVVETENDGSGSML